MPKSLSVLVTGATGKQGGAVARALLKKGHKVRAFTRKPDSTGSLELKKLGAELAVGSFADKDSLARAMKGVDAAFIMSTPFEAGGTEAETQQGLSAVDAAKAAGLQHVVYTSVGGANQKTGIPHFDSKFRVEEYLQKSGVPYTIIAPVWFNENFLGMFGQGLKQGVVALALPAQRKLQQVAVEEIGAVGAAVIDRREQFLGKRFDLASSELSGEQVAEVFSRVTGKPIRFQQVPIAQLRATSEDMARMFEWFDKVGYSADLAALRRELPEVPWRSFEEWARAQDWKQVLG
ncbi:MAG: NmrA/HSCARG family protein [Hyalangium sp.]|uniref:NmrA/HSCARG family protein n=1 Tax=Hyalangium sp. TaxID=2028555 RepID=UPI003899F653